MRGMPPVRPDMPLRLYDVHSDHYWQFNCLDEMMDFLAWSYEYWNHRPWRGRGYDPRYEPATCPPPERRITASEAMERMRITGNFHDMVWMDESVRIHDPEPEIKAAPEPSGDDDTPF